MGLTQKDQETLKNNIKTWAEALNFLPDATPDQIKKYVADRIAEAIVALNKKIEAANTEINNKITAAAAHIKTSIDGASPKFKIFGNYVYCKGARDVGIPGWGLNDDMSILGFQNSASANLGVGFNTDITVIAAAEAGILVATGIGGLEITVPVSLNFSGSVEASLSARDQAGPSSPNSPTSEVGAVPYLTLTVSANAGSSSLLSVNLGAGVTQDFELAEAPVMIDIEVDIHK